MPANTAMPTQWLCRNARDACFRAFLHNHWVGMAVFAGIALDYALNKG